MTLRISESEYSQFILPGIPKPTSASTTRQKKRRARNRNNYESRLVDACIKWLWAHGVFCWRNNTGALPTKTGRVLRFGLPGSSDILGISGYPDKAGKLIAVECKVGRGKLTKEQREFREHIQSRGGIFIEARSLDDLEARKGELGA